jgi:hypothetical protein
MTPSISLYAPSVYVDQLKHLMAEGDQSLSVYVCESGTCVLFVHNSLVVCLHIPATTSNLLWLNTSEKVWTGPILHSTENPIHVFPNKLLSLVPNFYIHASVSDLFISKIGLPIWLQQNRQTNPRNIEIAHRYMNVDIRIHNSVLEITRPGSFISRNI